MCEAKVVIRRINEEEEFMDSVVAIRNEGSQLLIVDLFGEQRRISADIKEVRLIEHKVVLEER